jgi:hypothetical protein
VVSLHDWAVLALFDERIGHADSHAEHVRRLTACGNLSDRRSGWEDAQVKAIVTVG